MSKRFASWVALIGPCAFLSGLAGCGGDPPPPPPAKVNGAPAVPQSVLNQMKGLPPEQQQRIQQQMQNSPQGGQVGQAIGSGQGSSSSGQ